MVRRRVEGGREGFCSGEQYKNLSVEIVEIGGQKEGEGGREKGKRDGASEGKGAWEVEREVGEDRRGWGKVL
jgi:hypothetical protein